MVAAVRWGAAHGVPVAVQPGGHAPRATLDGTLLLRTRALQGIDVDPVRRTATVGAGVNWGQLCDALDGTGLMALCGSNPDVTRRRAHPRRRRQLVHRKHGFTANSVVSFDVVGADGELRHVTRSSDPDLFWALRGGGGDFAVVVRMELALFDAAEMYGGQLMWPVEHAADVLRAFRDLALVAPRELSLWAHVMHFPPIPDVPEPLRGKSFVTVASTYLGDAKMAEILLWSLRDAAPVALDLMGPVTPAGLAAVAAEPTEPMPALEHSLLMSGLRRRGHRVAGRRGRRPDHLPAGDGAGPRPRRRLRRGRAHRWGRAAGARAVPAVRDGRAGGARAGRGDPARVRRHRCCAGRTSPASTGCPTSPRPTRPTRRGTTPSGWPGYGRSSGCRTRRA